MIETGACTRQLVVILVEVTKYDSQGYLIQFYKGVCLSGNWRLLKK